LEVAILSYYICETNDKLFKNSFMTTSNLTSGNFYNVSIPFVGEFIATFKGINKEQTHEGVADIATFTAHMDGEDHLIEAEFMIDFCTIAPFAYYL
jgi:hypothetical protein